MKACNGCGKCCEKYSASSGLGSATVADVRRFRKRPDILDWASPPLYDYWFSPVTGEETGRCPWLRKLPNRAVFKCRIHDVRPDTCRGYPVSRQQMVQDQCEMIEPGDELLSDKEFQTLLARMRNASANSS